MIETQKKRRGHNFLPPKAILDKIPKLYETENIPIPDKMVWLKYFGGAGTWYITELHEDRELGFGYCDLGVDMPEWGYVSLVELEELSVAGGMIIIERDCWFDPKPVNSIPEILT